MTWAPPLDPWPPQAVRRKHKVKLGEDFLSIAHDNLVADAWDLIYYNFGTEDPREVNWYLRHYVGCWFPAEDESNFDFTSSDDPGVIYVPPHGYSRASGLPYNRLVVAQLEKAMRHYPALSFMKYQVSRTELNEVIKALRSGRAYATHDPTIGTPAEWRPRRNIMAIKDANLTDWLVRNYLVHEATHAIVDNRKYDIYGWANEFLAYTAQALWGRSANDSRAEALVKPDLIVRSIWHYAYILARYLRGTGKGIMRVEDVDAIMPDYRDPTRTLNPVADLKLAIFNSRTYSMEELSKRWKFTGIDDS